MSEKNPQIGVTLYSFTRKFHSREYSLERLLREVAARRLGPRVEIVGFQSIKGFPGVDAEYVKWFRDLFDELELEPAAIGGNADGGLRRDRRLTGDEMLEYMAAQMRTAAALGFHVMRVQYSLKPKDMVRLLPLCEELDLKIGVEVHSHHTLHHPEIQAYIQTFQKTGSPYLGFTPDWGAAMEHIPASLIKRARMDGVGEDAIAYVQDYWDRAVAAGPLLDDRMVGEEMHMIQEAVSAMGYGTSAQALAINATGLFGKGRAEDWAEMLPYAVHTHGKFYDVENDDEPQSVPIAKVLKEYAKADYANTISMEWEGFHWNHWDDPFAMVQSEQIKVDRLWKQAKAELQR